MILFQNDLRILKWLHNNKDICNSKLCKQITIQSVSASEDQSFLDLVPHHMQLHQIIYFMQSCTTDTRCTTILPLFSTFTPSWATQNSKTFHFHHSVLPDLHDKFRHSQILVPHRVDLLPDQLPIMVGHSHVGVKDAHFDHIDPVCGQWIGHHDCPWWQKCFSDIHIHQYSSWDLPITSV